MKVEFTRLFLKDIDKINQSSVKRHIAAIIEETEQAIHFLKWQTSKS